MEGGGLLFRFFFFPRVQKYLLCNDFIDGIYKKSWYVFSQLLNWDLFIEKPLQIKILNNCISCHATFFFYFSFKGWILIEMASLES